MARSQGDQKLWKECSEKPAGPSTLVAGTTELAQRFRRAGPVSTRESTHHVEHTPRNTRVCRLLFFWVRCQVRGTRAPRHPAACKARSPSRLVDCVWTSEKTIDRGPLKGRSTRRARHPSVMTAGVCSSSAPSDRQTTSAVRRTPRDRTGQASPRNT